MSIITGSAAGSFSSGNTGGEEVQQQQQQELLNHANFHGSNSFLSTTPPNINSNGTQPKQPPQVKRKRNLPGTPGIIQTFFFHFEGFFLFSFISFHFVFESNESWGEASKNSRHN